MPAGAAANIKDPHSFLYDFMQKIELGPKESLDLGWLRGWIEGPIQ